MVSPVPGRTAGPGLDPAGSWDKIMVPPASAGSAAIVTRCPSPNIGAREFVIDGVPIAGLLGIAGGAVMVLGAAGAMAAGTEATGDGEGGAIGALACGIVGMGADASGSAGLGCEIGAAGAGRAAICGGCAAGVSPSN